MPTDTIKTRIEAIVTDKDNTSEDQLRKLKKMREDVRAEMRAATESAMVDDQDIGAELKAIDEAIESIDPQADGQNDGNAATL